MLSLRILDADYKQKINMNLTACSLVNRSGRSQHRTQDGADKRVEGEFIEETAPGFN